MYPRMCIRVRTRMWIEFLTRTNLGEVVVTRKVYRDIRETGHQREWSDRPESRRYRPLHVKKSLVENKGFFSSLDSHPSLPDVNSPVHFTPLSALYKLPVPSSQVRMGSGERLGFYRLLPTPLVHRPGTVTRRGE